MLDRVTLLMEEVSLLGELLLPGEVTLLQENSGRC